MGNYSVRGFPSFFLLSSLLRTEDYVSGRIHSEVPTPLPVRTRGSSMFSSALQRSLINPGRVYTKNMSHEVTPGIPTTSGENNLHAF